MIEGKTQEPEVWGSKPSSAVLSPWAKVLVIPRKWSENIVS